MLQVISEALEWLEHHRQQTFAAVGMALCRLSLGWVFLIFNPDVWQLENIQQGYAIVRMGLVVAYLVLALLASRRTPLLTLPWALGMTFAAALLYPVSLGLFLGFGATLPLGIALFAFGCGYAVLLLMWCEFLGTFAPRSALFVVLAEELLRGGLWFLAYLVDPVLGTIGSSILLLASMVMLVAGYRGSVATYRVMESGRGVAMPLRVAIWVGVFSFAYGLGSGITSLGSNTPSHVVGTALMAIVVLVLERVRAQEFDMSVFRRTTLVLVVAGFGLAALAGESNFFSHVFVCASQTAVFVFIVVAGSAVAYHARISCAFFCAVLLFANNTLALVGTMVGATSTQLGTGSTYLYAGVLVIVVLAGLLVFRDNDVLARDLANSTGADATASSDIRELAMRRGLTEREQMVLSMLLTDRTIAQISEELFIAPSTVRVHATNIYEKFGVHSRDELLGLGLGLGLEKGLGKSPSGNDGA